VKENGSYLKAFEFILSAFVLPLYLLKIYNYINKKLISKFIFPVYAIIILVCIVISARLEYSNWLATTQYPINSEEKDFILIMLIIQFGMGLGIGEIGLLAEYHNKKNASQE
jgi:hypothetical protein